MEPEEIEYDPKTNLPTLRDGLFWQISTTEGGYVTLSIVQYVTHHKHSFLGIKWGEVSEYKKAYEGLYSFVRDDSLSDTEIKKEAEKLYTDLNTIVAHKERVASLVGIYPPKKL